MNLIDKIKTDTSQIQSLQDLIQYNGEPYVGKPIWMDFKDGSYLHGDICIEIHWDVDSDESGMLYEPTIMSCEISLCYCKKDDVCEEITDDKVLKEIDKLIQL